MGLSKGLAMLGEQPMNDLMLPEPAFRLKWKDGAYYVSKPSIGDTDVFTADQMREYAKKAVEAEREACAKVCIDLMNEWAMSGDDEPDPPDGADCRRAILTRR